MLHAESATHNAAPLPPSPWPLPRIPALAAALGNILLPLFAASAPWTAPCSELKASVRPLPFTPDLTTSFVPACLGTLTWRGHVWTWELNSLRALRLHRALRALPSDDLESLLPPEVQLAALELLLEPLAHAAETRLHDAVTLGNIRFSERDTVSCCADTALLLEILLDAGEGMRETFLCCLAPQQNEAGRALLHTLRTLPTDAAPTPPALDDAIQTLTAPVSVLAGHVRLCVNDVAHLAPGDMLLPDDFPAAHGRALLCPSLGTGGMWHAFPCTLASRTLTVDGPLVTLSPEHPMTQDTTYIPESAQGTTTPETPNSSITDLLRVELRFELERRSMTVAEIGALAPGAVLTLTTDATSPVTLLAGDTVLGTGRLVDVDGVMGVQITSLVTRQP